MTKRTLPPTPEQLLDRAVDAARRERITSPGHPAAQRLAATAVERAQERKGRDRTRRVRALAVGAVVAALVAGAFIGAEMTSVPDLVEPTLGTTQAHAASPEDNGHETGNTAPAVANMEEPPARRSSPAASSTQLLLASGDRLHSSPGSSFEVLSDEGDRVVDLQEGDVLFDVAHQEGDRFSVQVGEVRIEVLGTVFSVLRQDDHVAVRVFEGVVAVYASSLESEAPRLLEVDEMWVSGRLEGLDAWQARSEELWQTVAPEGIREPARGAGGARVATQPESIEPNPSLSEARALLAAGDLESLLSLCERSDDTGAWRLYRADALRGLRQLTAAAEEYERAARALHGMQRIQAAFAAAQLVSEERPAQAVELLRTYDVTTQRSVLEERARSLELRLLERLGRTEELLSAQASYEARFGAELTSE